MVSSIRQMSSQNQGMEPVNLSSALAASLAVLYTPVYKHFPSKHSLPLNLLLRVR